PNPTVCRRLTGRGCARTGSWSSVATVAKPGNSDPSGSAIAAMLSTLEWVEVEPRGRIFSWERVWHPSHAALRQHGPYLAVLVELPDAGDVRMVENLLGDPMQAVAIGGEGEGGFAHHRGSDPPYSLLQWRV